MKYGEITKHSDDDIRGFIACEFLDLDIKLEKNKNKVKGDARPTFMINAKNKNGRYFEVGGAWVKKAESGKHKGETFLSMTVGTIRVKKLHLSAYPTNEAKTEYDIVYNIKDKKAK